MAARCDGDPTPPARLHSGRSRVKPGIINRYGSRGKGKLADTRQSGDNAWSSRVPLLPSNAPVHFRLGSRLGLSLALA